MHTAASRKGDGHLIAGFIIGHHDEYMIALFYQLLAYRDNIVEFASRTQ
jgi:hypothetical protein